jgi:hypothetical protein
MPHELLVRGGCPTLGGKVNQINHQVFSPLSFQIFTKLIVAPGK